MDLLDNESLLINVLIGEGERVDEREGGMKAKEREKKEGK